MVKLHFVKLKFNIYNIPETVAGALMAKAKYVMCFTVDDRRFYVKRWLVQVDDALTAQYKAVSGESFGYILVLGNRGALTALKCF